MSSRRRYKKKKNYTPVIVIFLIILAALLYVAYSLWTGQGSLGKTVSKEVTKKAIEKVISSQAGTDVNIDKIEQTMEPSDADALNSLMDKYATSDNLSKAVKAYSSSGGDLKSVEKQLKGQVNSSDVEKLKELYKKYGDSAISSTVQSAISSTAQSEN